MKSFRAHPFRLILWLAGCVSSTLPVQAITFTTDTTISATDTNYEGMEIVVTNCTLTVDGAHAFTSLTLLGGATLTHLTYSAGLNLTIAGDVLIEPGAAINVNARGYGPGVGPGAGNSQGNQSSGSGAGHGGYGGLGSSNTVSQLAGSPYGSLLSPVDKGSGGGAGLGGPGGNGGGAIKLSVGGTLRVNGSVSANGGNAINSRAGGGAGGSIWLTAQLFSGAGSVSADGGDGEPIHGGGGAGGRIAIYFATNSFTGGFSARGGAGFQAGGAGTIYTRNTNGPAGQLLVDNDGRAGAPTPVSTAGALDLTVQGQAVASVSSLSLRNLWIATNGSVISSSWRFPGDPSLLSLKVANNAVIEPGGGLLADGTSRVSRVGGGTSTNAGSILGNVGSGGGYGGYGGAGGVGPPGGAAFGNLINPTDFGTVGGNGGPSTLPQAGGAGGGAIRLTVNGALGLDGRISANGDLSKAINGGGGSGGSIVISAGTLSGNGVVSANGGAGDGLGGGGGGGRITLFSATNTFSGVTSARGGAGVLWGGAGTIYRSRGQSTPLGENVIIVDNGGPAGAVTTLGIGSFLPILPTPPTDLTVAGGARLLWPATGSSTLRHLLIASNAVLIATNAQAVTLTVQNSATIQAGGWLKGDGEGSAPSPQGGNGGTANSPAYGNTGGGGGHGGGGSPSLAGALGGAAFGSATQPTTRGGSGGPRITSGPLQGGAGGSAIRLNVTGTFQLDGKLSTDGHDGYSLHSGGGAGGCLYITVGRFAGSGAISANGGRGNGVGGSGSGGRIAIYYGSNLFSGVVSARGGQGVNAGGAGTIYSQRNTQSSFGAQLVLDNGGPLGMPSPLSVINAVDLMLRDGAQAQLTTTGGSASWRDVFIGSNAWLLVPNLAPAALVVSSNLTISAGGGINADGAPYGSLLGTGRGETFSSPLYGSTGGGGGHGGFGGASRAGAAGGIAYDSITAPLLAGSDGGGPQGGAGGGGGRAIRLSLPRGKLHLDGKISADGRAGNQHGGGGSGGSVWLEVGTLTGTGTISANGGAGSGVGGGGGGGRIAISCASNGFTGVITARGGPGGSSAGGWGAGGAGTIYTRTGSQLLGQVLLDNGGLFGTNTPLTDIGVFNLTVSGGAAANPSNSFLTLSNLFVDRDGLVTGGAGHTNLQLTVLSNVVVAAGGAIAVDGHGFAQGNGPGAGFSADGYGGGGGHGGAGGDSWTAPGGGRYGSATQPVERGSGGGVGAGPLYGGSQGGGALRLNVGGTLTVDGWLSANGIPGFQDGAGGGSGGSIWISTRTLRGNGLITADGGEGELFGGGGGGGGRISVQYLTNPGHTNNFTGGMTAYGGQGFDWGDDGSVFIASGVETLQVMAHTPSSTVSNPVSSMDVMFNTAINPFTASSADATFTTPFGPLSAGSLTVSRLNPSRLRIGFPLQTVAGNYSFTLGPQIDDLYGRPMAQVYTGVFTIAQPTARGMITDTNGLPVPGVTVTLVSSGFSDATTTDAAGHYALSFGFGSTFTVQPVLGGFAFAPAVRSYSGVLVSVTEQNFILLGSVAPMVSGAQQGTNFFASWHGLPGVAYRVYSSTNLVDWQPCSEPVIGSNALTQIPLPMDGAPQKFFRVRANY